MEENSSDSEHGYLEGPADSHTLSTRRKRRKTRGERNRLFDKSKHKKNHNKESQSPKRKGRSKSKGTTERRRFVAKLAVPMIKQNVSTITTHRLTRPIGLFDKMKTSETILRDLTVPEHTVQKTSDDLHKILDLEDTGLRKPVDIQKLKHKRFKPTSIRVANKDAKSKVDKGRRGKKVETSKVEIQTVCPASSDSSMSDEEDGDEMDVENETRAKENQDQFPKEPDFGTIVETVQCTLRAKNHFGDRDLVKEICSRLRTLHKSSNSPSPSMEMTPRAQQIPITAGSISSEVVKRDSFGDCVEVSKSDSEMHNRTLKTSAKPPRSGSSSSKRRIQLYNSGGKPKKPPSEEQLPITHTIPRITVDALSDARHLLHLNDNPTKVHQRQHQGDRHAVGHEPGYMESRVKAHEIRRALAPLTNVMDVQKRGFVVDRTYPRTHEKNRFPMESRTYDPLDHPVYNAPPRCNNFDETLGCHYYTRNTKPVESYEGFFESSSFIPREYNTNVIASNQNVVAQYLYPVGYEQGRLKGHGDPFKCYEDPLYSYPSVSLSSQETLMSTESYRSRRDGDRRYSQIDDIFTGDVRRGRRQRNDDCLDVPDHPDMSRRKHSKPKPGTPSPPKIYPCRLFSRYDE